MMRCLVRWFGLIALALALATTGLSTTAWAGPPPIDPKNMSGIPRPDPQVPSGTLTVRVLGEGGFSDPRVGIDVRLDVQGPDGTKTTRVEQTAEQGRATFTDLGAFARGRAVASATLGTTVVESLPIDILPNTGSRVMLVQGAPARSGASAPHGQPAGPSVPMPGTAFPLDGQPAGTLTVGTFDLAAKQPLAGVAVTLTIEQPDGPPIVKAADTDAGGKVLFEGLQPPEVPRDAKLTVEATLVADGELRKSAPFTMDPEKGMAVVLAEGAEGFDPAAAAARAPQRRRPVPPPKIVRSLDPGTVRVRIVEGNDQPLPDQPMTLVKKTAGGGVSETTGTTDSSGTFVFEDVGVQQDALYFVQSVYDQGPYQSRFFGMDRRGGVSVTLRVFPTTSDRSVVRSAVQYDVDELENDKGQIVQIYEVMVTGDEAFWDPRGLKVDAMPGAKGFTVLRPAEPWLDHEESAPFATLHGPIPPGELANLSVGYLVEHEGEVTVDWTPPFEVVEASILVAEDFELLSDGAEISDRPSQVPGKTVYTLDVEGDIEFTMAGLETRNPIFRTVALYGGVGLGVIVILGFALHDRGTPRQRLEARRDELLAMLESLASDAAERERVLSALDGFTTSWARSTS